jgi:hypothetical protein
LAVCINIALTFPRPFNAIIRVGVVAGTTFVNICTGFSVADVTFFAFALEGAGSVDAVGIHIARTLKAFVDVDAGTFDAVARKTRLTLAGVFRRIRFRRGKVRANGVRIA